LESSSSSSDRMLIRRLAYRMSKYSIVSLERLSQLTSQQWYVW
jgi:hypothetical protein